MAYGAEWGARQQAKTVRKKWKARMSVMWRAGQLMGAGTQQRVQLRRLLRYFATPLFFFSHFALDARRHHFLGFFEVATPSSTEPLARLGHVEAQDSHSRGCSLGKCFPGCENFNNFFRRLSKKIGGHTIRIRFQVAPPRD